MVLVIVVDANDGGDCDGDDDDGDGDADDGDDDDAHEIKFISSRHCVISSTHSTKYSHLASVSNSVSLRGLLCFESSLARSSLRVWRNNETNKQTTTNIPEHKFEFQYWQGTIWGNSKKVLLLGMW